MEPHEYAKMARLQADHWWFEAKRRVVGAVMARHVAEARIGRLLEVGCGTGAMVPLLGRYGAVVGVDVYPQALEHVAGAERVAGSALELPFADGAFDAVACFDILYHRNVPDVDAALGELARVTAPGGWLVITDSACPLLFGAHDRAHHGARRFSRRGLRRHLGAAGYRVPWISYFHTAVFPAVACSRLGGEWLRRLARRPEPAAGASQLQSVWSPVNQWLKLLYRVEAALAARTGLPFGVSLVALARRASGRDASRRAG